MKELGGGTSAKERTRRDGTPSDLEEFDRTGGWLVSFSPTTRTFLIEVSDYHPGRLVLDRDDLMRMLAHLEPED